MVQPFKNWTHWVLLGDVCYYSNKGRQISTSQSSLVETCLLYTVALSDSSVCGFLGASVSLRKCGFITYYKYCCIYYYLCIFFHKCPVTRFSFPHTFAPNCLSGETQFFYFNHFLIVEIKNRHSNLLRFPYLPQQIFSFIFRIPHSFRFPYLPSTDCWFVVGCCLLLFSQPPKTGPRGLQ